MPLRLRGQHSLCLAGLFQIGLFSERRCLEVPWNDALLYVSVSPKTVDFKSTGFEKAISRPQVKHVIISIVDEELSVIVNKNGTPLFSTASGTLGAAYQDFPLRCLPMSG